MYWSGFFVLLLAYVSVKAKPIDQPIDLTDEERKNIGILCLKQTGADLDVINLAIETQTAPRGHPKYKEFLTCSYKLQGYQDETGHILYDNIYAFLGKFYSRQDLKVLDPCRHIKETTDAENAFNALDCILERLKTLEA